MVSFHKCNFHVVIVVVFTLTLHAFGKRLQPESRREESRCCCRGPDLDQCRRLTEEQLADSSVPWKDKVCPKKAGYHHYSEYFETVPPRCNKDDDASVRKNVTLKAYWMRHGWSCANALKHQGTAAKAIDDFWDRQGAKLDARKFFLYADPGLTDAAIHRAEFFGRIIKQRICEDTQGQVPLVFSSSLTRSMETALWNFPEWNVRPIPYIAENNPMPDNTPLPWGEQISRRLSRAPNNGSLLQHLVYDSKNPSDHADRDSSRKSSYEHFKRYFPGLLESLLDAKSVDADQEIPVIIVSHSSYMKGNLECKGLEDNKGKPHNNEVWVQRYTFELGAYDAVLQPAGCEALLDDHYFPTEPKLLCKDDVQRCGIGGDRMPDSWLEQDEGECANHVGKNVVERDTSHKEGYTSVPLPAAGASCSAYA